MAITEIIVHRANSPVNTDQPYEQVNYYINAGFKKLEIDVYAISETTYKFCHPTDKDKVHEIHDISDGFLEEIVRQHPDVQWYIDLKCLDLIKVPVELLQYLTDVFGDTGIVIAAQNEILEFAHRAGRKTAQYFKDNIDPVVDFTPDLFVQNDSENKKFPKESTVVFCPDPKVALHYLGNGYFGAMVDGYKLIP